jgi:hypothetical protein
VEKQVVRRDRMLQDQSRPITVPFNPDHIPWYFFKDLLREAAHVGQEEALCKHLVGASLHLAFPEATRDDPTYRVDNQTVPMGHFLVGDMVFHVILAPVMKVYDKCRENIENGFRVWMLVPEKYFCGTRQNAEIILPGKITVSSIEYFVSQNLERLAGFYRERLGEALRLLLETYNERIITREEDLNLLIYFLPNLTG